MEWMLGAGRVPSEEGRYLEVPTYETISFDTRYIQVILYDSLGRPRA